MGDRRCLSEASFQIWSLSVLLTERGCWFNPSRMSLLLEQHSQHDFAGAPVITQVKFMVHTLASD